MTVLFAAIPGGDIMTERVSKVDKNKMQKENSLLRTAFDYFTTKGFSKTSISDIVEKAGVAKGTFYLYFKDKYDIRNRLIAHKSSQLFKNAFAELEAGEPVDDAGERIIRIVDSIVDQLEANQALLTFISKNLSWGIFKNALETRTDDDDVNLIEVYDRLLETSPCSFADPEVMLFMIIELVSSTCYSAILYKEPCTLEELKPYLYDSIRAIVERHRLGDTECEK